MMVALLVLAFASLVFWLVFFRFKLIRLTPGWGVIFGFFVVHLLLVFVIGLRFVTPNSANATVVQRTIQLVPRLPEPTLVDAVLVEEGAAVKKGQPLFQFDRRPYQYKVDQISAQLEEHLTISEVQHVRLRVKRLLRAGRFPRPSQDWPAVPWPPV